MTDVENLVRYLRFGRYPVSTEGMLQLAIAAHLDRGKFEHEREYRLAPAERIDFFVRPGIGIEAKTKCQPRKIYRQLERYAEKAEIRALVLITGTAMGLPPRIHGKPVFYVSCGRSAL